MHLAWARFLALFRISTFLILSLSVFGCSNSGNPTGPDDGGPGDVLETGSASISSEGGMVTLSDGTGVFVPSGAMSGSGEVTVAKKDPAGYFDTVAGVTRVVLSCSAPVNGFAKEVEIRVPLPAGMTEADSSRIMAGLIDEATGAVEVGRSFIRMENGKPFAILPVSHFSSYIIKWFTGPTPPASAGPIEIPYYGQGASPYCWAASVQMVTQAARFADDREIADIIARMGVDEGGITSLTFRFSGELAELIRTRTGSRPDRSTWDYVNINQMREYLKREIGVNGRPVALHNGVWEHAVVVLGYDGNTFYIHDPASTSGDAIGYTARTWKDIAGNMGMGSNMTVLSIPVSLDSSRPRVTVNITPGAFIFMKPKDSASAASNYQFRWDHRVPAGYSFTDDPLNRAAPGLTQFPGGVKSLAVQSGTVEVVNSSRSETRSVSVWLDITSLGAGGTHFSRQTSFSIPPNSTRYFTMNPVPVDSLRDNNADPTEYLLSLTALDDGTVVDKASIRFSIEKEEPRITSILPNTGPVGTVVTIAGERLGTCRGLADVSFGNVKATEIVLWKENEIKVKVPAKAATGNVTVTRGTISSNGMKYTVTTEQRMGDTYVYTDDLIRATTTWEVSGTGLWTDYGTYDFYVHPRYDMEPNKAGTMQVTFSAELVKTEKIYTYESGDYVVTTYHAPEFLDEEKLLTEGEFPQSYSREGQTLTAEYTFTEPGQYFAFEISYVVPYDQRTYDKDGKLKSERLNQVDPAYVHTACRVVALARTHQTK